MDLQIHLLCRTENLALELSYSEAPVMRAWIDPEVVELAGISDEELLRYLQPADYVDQGVCRSWASMRGPHMSNYPPGVYERTRGVR